MQDIANLYPELVSVVQLGHSGEGREMLGMKISRPSEVENELVQKKGFVITGAQHAREVSLRVVFLGSMANMYGTKWVATASAIYLSHALVANASEPYSLSHLLDFFVSVP